MRRADGLSFARIGAMVLRHLYVLRGSWPRLFELAYWPTMQMIIWGFITVFLYTNSSWVARAFGVLLSGVMLWDVLFRGQLGFTLSFMEEMWSRNLGHIFVSPLRLWELVAALLVMSFIRMASGVLPAIGLAYVLYAFNLFTLGPIIVLFFANLMIMGWWIALGVISLILRHGAGAEPLAWTLLFGITPFAAVFYPVSVLPHVMQWAAFIVPASHVFEGMRAVLTEHSVLWGQLGLAFVLNIAWTAAATLLFARQFRVARMRGALLTIGE
jgi:ABC-2 type transport system permease protein